VTGWKERNNMPETWPPVYSDKEILNGIHARDIVIDPFSMPNLGTSSYDVRLGEWYYREQKPIEQDQQLLFDRFGFGPAWYNIYDFEEVDRVWGKACKAELFSIKKPGDFTGIKPDDSVIWIDPGETILAHTEEYIGGKNHITTMMKARSSFGRNFIEICKCAGWGDVGYINRWTMEITNNSRYYSIPLVVGRRIAQLIFFETGPILNSKKDYAADGKYQSHTDLAALRASWRPDMMLPKLYNDREIRS
jgi:dCTP deaminase